MTLKEISEKYKIGIRDLKVMVRERIISEEPTSIDISHIDFLSKFWGKYIWIKRQMASMNKKKRLTLIETGGMTKIESYVYTRYVNANTKVEKLSAKRVGQELNDHYGVKINDKVMQMIYNLKRKAENQRAYINKKDS